MSSRPSETIEEVKEELINYYIQTFSQDFDFPVAFSNLAALSSLDPTKCVLARPLSLDLSTIITRAAEEWTALDQSQAKIAGYCQDLAILDALDEALNEELRVGHYPPKMLKLKYHEKAFQIARHRLMSGLVMPDTNRSTEYRVGLAITKASDGSKTELTILNIPYRWHFSTFISFLRDMTVCTKLAPEGGYTGPWVYRYFDGDSMADPEFHKLETAEQFELMLTGIKALERREKEAGKRFMPLVNVWQANERQRAIVWNSSNAEREEMERHKAWEEANDWKQLRKFRDETGRPFFGRRDPLDLMLAGEFDVSEEQNVSNQS